MSRQTPSLRRFVMFSIVAMASVFHNVAARSTEQTLSTASMCVQVTPAIVGTITSAAYSDTNSQYDLPAAKHCEYRGGQHVVSITLIVGANAESRFAASKKFPGIEPVPKLGDEAVWEPIRGVLSVRAGDRAFDVMVNSAHGTVPARLQFARQIAQLVLAGR